MKKLAIALAAVLGLQVATALTSSTMPLSYAQEEEKSESVQPTETAPRAEESAPAPEAPPQREQKEEADSTPERMSE